MTENIEIKKDDAQNSGWGRAKKVLRRVGWVLLGLLAVMWAIGFFAPEFTEAIPERFPAWIQGKIEARNQAALDAEIEKIREKYKNDLDGGKTPEETLDLFIEALKAGDIEKASKYYVLEKQAEEFKHLSNDILGEYGDLQKSIDYYSRIKEKGVKKCNEISDGCTFEYIYTEIATTTYEVAGINQKIIVPAGEKTTESVDVGLNSFSGVWKIKLP